MFLNDMEVGKSIEIFICRSGYKYRLVSKLEDVNEDNFSVTLITGRSKVFHFEDTDKIEIIYRHGHQLWRWTDLKVSIAVLDDNPVHQFLAVGDRKGGKFNRRDAFRVFIGEEVILTYYVIKLIREITDGTAETEGEIAVGEVDFEMEHCYGLIKDLSETGVGIFSNNEFDSGDELEFTLDTPYGMLKCKAEVVRINKESQGTYRYFYGCIFTGTSKNMVKYIYGLQRKRLNGINDR